MEVRRDGCVSYPAMIESIADIHRSRFARSTYGNQHVGFTASEPSGPRRDKLRGFWTRAERSMWLTSQRPRAPDV